MATAEGGSRADDVLDIVVQSGISSLYVVDGVTKKGRGKDMVIVRQTEKTPAVAQSLGKRFDVKCE